MTNKVQAALCPWPGCELAVDHPGQHLTAADDSSDDMVTRHKEVVSEVRFAPDDEAAGAEVVAMAVVGSFNRKAASNGSNITSIAEVDSAYSEDFKECMGEATFIIRVEGQEYGECQVMTVHSWTDVEAMVHTRVLFKWTDREYERSKGFGAFVSKTNPIRLELWRVQQVVFGAKAD
jgi:hypothetical protein